MPSIDILMDLNILAYHNNSSSPIMKPKSLSPFCMDPLEESSSVLFLLSTTFLSKSESNWMLLKMALGHVWKAISSIELAGKHMFYVQIQPFLFRIRWIIQNDNLKWNICVCEFHIFVNSSVGLQEEEPQTSHPMSFACTSHKATSMHYRMYNFCPTNQSISKQDLQVFIRKVFAPYISTMYADPHEYNN